MKTIGMIGGMSYESSIHYYQRINDGVNELAGGLTCAKMLVYNVNFEDIRKYMLNGEWDKIGAELVRIAKILEQAGSDYIVVATNTMHKLASQIQNEISIPLIHIADCVAEECKKNGVQRVGLIGTRYTMTEDFLVKRLEENGLIVSVPTDKMEIDDIDNIIFNELCKGQVNEDARKRYIEIVNQMIEKHKIEGLILGCTEIEMLLKPGDVSIPLFDTTQAHINSIIDYCLERKR